MLSISRYSKFITLAAAIVLIISCFLPWAFYPDLNKSFTGWFTENNVYGRPGKFLSFMAVFSILAQFLPYLILKRINLLLMGLNLAYAFFTFIKYAKGYSIVEPQRLAGIYIMLLASIVLMFTALFPSGELKKEPQVPKD